MFDRVAGGRSVFAWTCSARCGARQRPPEPVYRRSEGLFGCAPGRTRTCDLEIRRLLLYPAELRGPGTRRPGRRRQCRCGPDARLLPPERQLPATRGRGRAPRAAAGGRARAGGATPRRRPRSPSTAGRHTSRAPAPSGWRPPGAAKRPRVTWARNGPPSGAAPDDRARRAHGAGERRQTPPLRPPGQEHPRPRHVREAAAAGERERAARRRARRGLADARRRGPRPPARARLP